MSNLHLPPSVLRLYGDPLYSLYCLASNALFNRTVTRILPSIYGCKTGRVVQTAATLSLHLPRLRHTLWMGLDTKRGRLPYSETGWYWCVTVSSWMVQPGLSCWQVMLPAVVFAGLNKALCLDNNLLSSWRLSSFGSLHALALLQYLVPMAAFAIVRASSWRRVMFMLASGGSALGCGLSKFMLALS